MGVTNCSGTRYGIVYSYSNYLFILLLCRSRSSQGRVAELSPFIPTPSISSQHAGIHFGSVPIHAMLLQVASHAMLPLSLRSDTFMASMPTIAAPAPMRADPVSMVLLQSFLVADEAEEQKGAARIGALRKRVEKQKRRRKAFESMAQQLRGKLQALTRLTVRQQPGALVLVRHGQSTWNDENRFTGWANVPLNERGRQEARDAAVILLSEDNYEFDACYTSVLGRSVETASIILDAWEAAGRRRPETFARWRLNERHYGMLTGLNKREALKQFASSDLRLWRSSFEGRPPPMEPDHPHYSRTAPRYERLLAARTMRENEPEMSVLGLDDVPLTESLADTRTRVESLWQAELLPQVLSGKNVLVVGHANCLRALISTIQGNLSDKHLPSLGVPNALPLVYSLDTSGKPIINQPEKCYIKPLDAHYLGEACVLFNELDADGSGALDAAEFDDSEFCRVAGDGFDGIDEQAAEGCGDRLLSEADNNNDGAVDFNEYMNWWSQLDSKPRFGKSSYRDL